MADDKPDYTERGHTSRAAIWSHDCLSCRYIGRVDGSNPYHEGRMYIWDLYVCPGGPLGETIIARYGLLGEYQSAPRKVIEDQLKAGQAMHPALLWALALLQMEERK